MSELFIAKESTNKSVYMAYENSLDKVVHMAIFNQDAITYDFIGATYDLDTFECLVQSVGVGVPITPHASPMYAPDHEGVMREYGVDAPVWQGGRRVTNSILQSEDFSSATWNKLLSTFDPLTDIYATSSRYGALSQDISGLYSAGEQFIVTVDCQYVSGNITTVTLASSAGFSGISMPILMGDGVRRKITSSALTTGDGSTLNILQEIDSGNPGTSWKVYSVQFEKATGRSDLNTPSEYIKTEATAVTKILANANGNTVLDNVVTEGTGAPLSPQPMLVSQDEVTNYLLYSNIFDAGILYWTHTLVTVTESTELAPDGSLASELDVYQWGGYLRATSVVSQTGDRVASIWMKQGGSNPATHIVLTTNNTVEWSTGLSVKFPMPTEWTKLEISGLLSDTDTCHFIIGNVGADGTPNDTDSIGTCLIWQAQLETGLTSAQGTIFTEASPVTTGVRPTFDAANHSNTDGPIGLFFDYSAEADMDILSLTEGAYLKVEDGGVGAELVTDGTFDQPCGVDWVCGDGWTISGNAANTLNSPHGSDLSNPTLLGTVSGTNYILSFEIFNYTSGGLTIYFDGTSPSISGTKYSGAGIYNLPFEAVGDSTFRLQADAVGWGATDFDIRNVSIKEAAKVLSLTDQTNSVSLPMPTAPATVEAYALYEQGENEVLHFTGSEYGTLSTPVSFAGDATLEITFSTTELSSAMILVASLTGNNYMFIDTNNNKIYLSAVGHSAGDYDVSPMADGASHTIKMVQTGAVTDIYFDGGSIGQYAGTFLSYFAFGLIGKRETGLNYIGTLGAVKFTDLVNSANSQTYLFDSGSIVEEVSEEDPLKVCSFTGIDASNWLQGDGKMQLKLDTTYSAEVDYDNSFGTGDLVVGATVRILNRRAETEIQRQRAHPLQNILF